MDAIPPLSPDSSPTFTSLERQAEMLAAGEVSSSALVERALAMAEELQPSLTPFRVIVTERARAAATSADERLAAGERAPLLGVPFAIKDDVDLAGESTPFGCGGEHAPAAADSELVRRVREAGAVIIGKTMTPEVGQWHFSESTAFGAARNPWSPAHTPGGSSGGGAAAVAAGIVAGTIGSDGAGSVRIPAAWCGLVGLKPQRGRISTWPHAEAFNGLTCFGPLTRTVGDAALLLDVLAGSHDGDLHRPPAPAEPFAVAARRDPGRLRIALSCKTPFGVSSKLDPEIRAAVERTAARLGELGHEVIREDPRYGLIGPALVPRGSAGAREWCEHLPDHTALEPRTQVGLRIGSALDGLPLRLARRAERPLKRRVGAIFDRVDVVLTPTTAQLPPLVGALDGEGWWKTSNTASALCPYAWPWNVLGWPGLSVPAGHSATGLPIGAQLLGRENDEATLLALATQLEGAERWADRRPGGQSP
jgi:amidase